MKTRAAGDNFARWSARRRRGFTLVESLLSIVIVSGVMVAALGTFGAIGRARLVQVDRAAGEFLAQRTMAEILSMYYQDPVYGTPSMGPNTGENNRSLYNDVDDYDNYQASPPTYRDGTALPGYTGWKVKVKVKYAKLDDPGSTTGTNTGLKSIRVTVTSPAGAVVDVYGNRSKDGLYEQLPYQDTNYLVTANVTAQVGDKGKTMYGGSHPMNITTGQ